jgi:hypothetical protein
LDEGGTVARQPQNNAHAMALFLQKNFWRFLQIIFYAFAFFATTFFHVENSKRNQKK